MNGTVTHIVDGDTFEVSARIWLGEAVDVRVRIEGIDAPELHARCVAEFRRAEAARNYLSQRIAGGEVELDDLLESLEALYRKNRVIIQIRQRG